MPDIFMHFVFRRWFTHKPAAWQPPPEPPPPPEAPPRKPPDRR
jgi:hypothetical protein